NLLSPNLLSPNLLSPNLLPLLQPNLLPLLQPNPPLRPLFPAPNYLHQPEHRQWTKGLLTQ
ncbi:MAG: hypothetical protein EBR82_71225, partial [Caulobacteraceae bacterium]|nr:hypothetical protein [Caulobacteraceae bacterium]